MTNFHPQGFTLQLEGLLVLRSYGGVMEGRPSNEEVITAMTSYATRMWGNNVPVVVVVTTPLTKLPKYAISALWLSHQAVKDETMSGSHLIVLTFADTLLNMDALFAVVNGVDWSKSSTDWEY